MIRTTRGGKKAKWISPTIALLSLAGMMPPEKMTDITLKRVDASAPAEVVSK